VIVEIEVFDAEEAARAADAGADIVLIDNASAEEVARVVRATGHREKTLIEASGGITLDNVVDYARTGVQRISVGGLTHSARALDLSPDDTRIGVGSTQANRFFHGDISGLQREWMIEQRRPARAPTFPWQVSRGKEHDYGKVITRTEPEGKMLAFGWSSEVS
jgi:hypothetical protein